ncbi:hypothetical protein [Marisediminicola sp. LYQ85]|uniref:hypothetical protein n=1 Tax=Marisediminicola sp. LYQ85 TaxID=3391062 RepID=UPI0039837A77
MPNTFTLAQPAAANASGSRALRTTAVLLTVAAVSVGLALFAITGDLAPVVVTAPLAGLAAIALYLHLVLEAAASRSHPVIARH